MPGVKEKDLELTLTGDRLTIAGKREGEEQKKGERYYVYERTYGEFTRTFTLPAGVDAQHVTAELKEGVLKLTLPKVPEAQAKKIPVAATPEANKPAGHA
jgi:HSP20 family protein